MSDIDQINKPGVFEDDVTWTEYPLGTCFECKVGLIAEDDGSFSVYAINLPGVASQGDTEGEAIANIADALAGVLTEYKACGEIPWSDDFMEDGAIERRVLVNLNQIAIAG